MKRRIFIQQTGLASLGFWGLSALLESCTSPAGKTAVFAPTTGYGPLMPDPKGIVNLPEGFTYQVIATRGQTMSDGLRHPGKADGMATFAAPDGKVLLICNHEISAGDAEEGPFGDGYELLENVPSDHLYDYGRGLLPCLGGTTTLLFDPATGKVEKSWLSLAGTIRNCAGGLTPWGSWLSCEENTAVAGEELEKNHGYVFEVPATTEIGLAEPFPLKEMGRFNHEAVAVDPRTGIVYETEDRGDGLFYRFIPNEPGKLRAGGKLQALVVRDQPAFDTRNWPDTPTPLPTRQPLAVSWIDIDNVESPDDDLRIKGFEAGAARFARGEGIWFGDEELYFACTNGGSIKAGQVFRYRPGEFEGEENEAEGPGTLELFLEPNNTQLLESCDNLTIAPSGHLFLCEDKDSPRIVGVSPAGDLYHFAHNVGYESEFAGATFSPDGKHLFVNIQHPGLTLAITGPWESLQAAT